jgi:hypothetical protein
VSRSGSSRNAILHQGGRLFCGYLRESEVEEHRLGGTLKVCGRTRSHVTHGHATTMNDTLRFAEVYRRLADDELARVALSNHLVPEAQEAVKAELQRRGLNDLSEYKHTLEEAAGTTSLGAELAFQGGLKRPTGDGVFVFAAWVLALSVPLIFLSAPPPGFAVEIRVCLAGTALIAVSCYRGLKARREGSHRGFVLKFVLPLILLGLSTTVVIIGRLLGLSL